MASDIGEIEVLEVIPHGNNIQVTVKSKFGIERCGFSRDTLKRRDDTGEPRLVGDIKEWLERKHAVPDTAEIEECRSMLCGRKINLKNVKATGQADKEERDAAEARMNAETEAVTKSHDECEDCTAKPASPEKQP